MAIVKVLEIKGLTRDVEEKLKRVTETLREQKEITIEFEKELQKLERELEKTADFGKQTRLKGEISSIKDALKDQRLALKELNLEKANLTADKAQLKSLQLTHQELRGLDLVTGGYASKLGNLKDAVLAARSGVLAFVKSLNLTKAALISTGIGALVVALGTIVAYWDDIVEAVTGVNKGLEEQLRITKEVEESLDRISFLRNQNLRLVDQETKQNILRAKIAGASEEELTDIQRKGLEKRIKIQEELAEEAKRIFEKSNDDTREAALKAQELAFLELGKARGNLAIFNLEQQVPGKQKAGSRDKQRKVDPLTGQDLDEARQNSVDFFNEIFELDKANKDALQESTDAALERLLTSEELAEAKRTLIAEEGAKSRERIAELEAQAKVESFMIAANGFAAASDLIGRETAAGKAFAVASTLVSTYLAAQQAYASQLTIPTPDAPFRAAAAAAVAVAAGLANVKQILSVKVPGQGGGSFAGGSPSTPPAFNVVQNSPQNQLNQSLLEQNGQPVEAFVVDKNVTSAQELRRNKVSASSLG